MHEEPGTEAFVTSRRRKLLLGLGVVAALALVIFGGRAAHRAWAQRSADVAVASLHRCLLGAPLAEGERPSGRLRRIGLAGGAEGWPDRCEGYARDLAKALDDVDRERAAYVRVQIAGPGFDVSDIERSPYDFDAFFMSEPVNATAPASVPEAPAPIRVADERLEPLVPKGSLIGASADPVPAGELRFLVAGALCTLDRKLEHASCAPPRVSGDRAALWPGTEDGGPVLVSNGLLMWGAGQITRQDTGEVVCGEAESSCRAFGGADGGVTVLDRKLTGGRWVARLERRGGSAPSAPVDPSPALGDHAPLVLRDRLVWRDRARQALRAATWTGDRLDAVDIAPAPVDSDLRACRTAGATVLHTGDGRRHHLTFLTPDGVAKSVEVDLPEPATGSGVELTCGEGDVFLIEVRSISRRRTDFNSTGYVVPWARCTAERCESGSLSLDTWFSGAAAEPARPDGIGSHDVRAVGLGGKLLVVWRSAAGGIRMRLAAPSEIARAKDVVIYDDRMSNGVPFKMSLVYDDFRLLGRHAAALLLLSRMGSREGLVALRIDPGGEVTPVKRR